jgi:hypothetical protein
LRQVVQIGAAAIPTDDQGGVTPRLILQPPEHCVEGRRHFRLGKLSDSKRVQGVVRNSRDRTGTLLAGDGEANWPVEPSRCLDGRSRHLDSVLEGINASIAGQSVVKYDNRFRLLGLHLALDHERAYPGRRPPVDEAKVIAGGVRAQALKVDATLGQACSCRSLHLKCSGGSIFVHPVGPREDKHGERFAEGSSASDQPKRIRLGAYEGTN